MPLDPVILDANRHATERIRALADRISDEAFQRRVGEHWTVAIVFAHLAFWDRRALDVIDRSERERRASDLDVPVVVNDLSLPLWAVIPPHEAVRLAIESAEALDARLAALAPEVADAVLAARPRMIRRSLHRNEHLDEAEAALAH